jgi:hypothetical protein
MADAFREGVPLGYQRAFVTLADAYCALLADFENLSRDCADVTEERNQMGRYLRFPLPDGSTQLVSRPLYITGAPVPMHSDPVRSNVWAAPDVDTEPVGLPPIGRTHWYRHPVRLSVPRVLAGSAVVYAIGTGIAHLTGIW